MCLCARAHAAGSKASGKENKKRKPAESLQPPVLPQQMKKTTTRRWLVNTRGRVSGLRVRVLSRGQKGGGAENVKPIHDHK